MEKADAVVLVLPLPGLTENQLCRQSNLGKETATDLHQTDLSQLSDAPI